MDIVSPNQSASKTFIIYPGKQVTLYATGLSGDDKVYVELLHLSRAPEFNGNPCCDISPVDIQILGTTILKCADGNEAVLTAEYPFFVLDTPQNVPLRVRVDADPSALVTVELQESDSDGCMACTCRCYDTVWTPTGQERCVNGNVEREEKSNCGTLQWVVDRPQSWVATGQTRCENWAVEKQEVNDCGTLRWTATGETCYCPSLSISCEGQPGFGYHEMDPKDPAATVEMAPCPGDTSTDSIWIYPSAGKGHTIKITDCDGNVIGYAANCSNCAC